MRSVVWSACAPNLQEIAARGGKIVLFSDEDGCAELGPYAWKSVCMPAADPLISPTLRVE